jgi:CDP-glucose 4,6-dehydratase
MAVASTIDAGFWRGKRVFLTGHTGFKGSWLALWLSTLGARVHGFALPAPTTPALFHVAAVDRHVHHQLGNVTDAQALQAALAQAQPDIVFHLAAQALVRQSYAAPVLTYHTNVMGTVHLLEAVRHCPSVRAVVNVTTDKCYDNREWVWGYREHEALGGHDPYSSSKACSEMVTAAYRASFLGTGGAAVATARAGNVIGGGDWAQDRLVPDLLRAFAHGQPALVRHPGSTRPWQHVLEPLRGYIDLAQRLCQQRAGYAEAWNIGPAETDARPVAWVADRLSELWGDGAAWGQPVDAPGPSGPHEHRTLSLDTSKARARLGWQPCWTLDTALEQVVLWHRAWLAGADMHAACLEQIARYTHDLACRPQ